MNGAFRIAGVVVFYRPKEESLYNLHSYLAQVERLYVVDNSEQPDSRYHELLSALTAVEVIPNQGNAGVAHALNLGAERALADGCDFLLTMDQDSLAEPGMVETMLACLAGRAPEMVGMLSPFHLTRSGPKFPAEMCSDVMTPMTSGCLLNLAAFRQVGPFRDDFFIDFVDNEYCLRLRRAGYAVLRANRAVLYHRVGDTKKYGPFIATHHSPVRRYYKTRNRLWVFREYLSTFPGHCLFDLVRLAKEVVSILLFEREKGKKLLMMIGGVRDYLQGRYGKFKGAGE